MASCVLVLSIILVAIASAYSTKDQLTKTELMHKMDSKTILEMLVKMMNTEYADKDDETAYTNQGTGFIMRTIYSEIVCN